MRTSTTCLLLGVCVLAVGLAACKTTETIGYPAEYVSVHSPQFVWVTRPDDSTLQLFNPELHGDTLVGFDKGAYTEVPLADVRIMRAHVLSPMKTALFASGIAIGAAVTVVELTGGGGPANVCITPGTDYVTVCGSTGGLH